MLYSPVMTQAQASDAKAGPRPFDESERTRFHNLLKLAAESPFKGERAAALAAAGRMAKSHGMTLQEAATGGPEPEPPKQPFVARSGPHAVRARDVGRAIHLMDNWVANDKARREAALAEAFERGLDDDKRKRDTAKVPRRNFTKRNPQSHAKVLLQETSLPLLEICSLTGLDIYEVVGLKLKLRTPNSA